MSIKVFTDKELEITIDYFPINFYVYDVQGNKEQGKIEFRSEEIIDDYWGSYISFEYSWETIPFDERDSDGDLISEIDVHFSKLGMVTMERIQKYIQSNFLQYLIGSRVIHVKGHPYPVVEIHGVFYSDYSERLVNFQFRILREIFSDWKNAIIQLIESVHFHV